MARGKSGKKSGKLALKLALVLALVASFGAFLAAVGVIQNLASAVPSRDADIVHRTWLIAVGVAVVVGVVAGVVAWMLGGQLGSRITDLGLAVAKLGRGSAEVRVRFSGDDEIAALGRSIQYLATDLQQLLQEQDKAGAIVSMDPLVHQLRDKTLPQGFAAVAGFEIDGALSAGSRGGLDYFDLVTGDGGTMLYLVSGEGTGALAVVACRMARDELRRALQQGVSPRKALAHTNKVLHQQLPKGVCAKATVLQLEADQAKLYQAGARAPLLFCSRGDVLELAAEGIALGLDDGPVFEKSLRPQELQLAPGMRLLLVNEAALRLQPLLDLIKLHSPKHTAMFMNMVLGNLEQDAGSEGLREDVVLVTAKKV